jgi:hypothetical protein
MANPKQLSPKDIIAQSGHTHHSKVVAALRQLGWSVTVSPYYSDNFTDKPREIDIIAEKAFDRSDRVAGIRGHVVVRLFIECKYVPSTTVFWFDAKDMARAIELVARDTGWNKDDLAAYAHPYIMHQLAREPVAKLFSSGRSDDSEGFARAINQTLNGLAYYRHREVARRNTNAHVLAQLTFPLIALNSFALLHRTDMNDSVTIPIAEPFQLEVNYAYKQNNSDRNEYFLIDVVSLDSLALFLTSIEENEVRAMGQHVFRRHVRR